MWRRRVLKGLAVLLGVLLISVLGAWLYLTSDAGAERIRALVLTAAGDALAGKLEAKKLTLHGGIIVLEDVKLFTPEGELVAELKRAELDVGLAPLLGKDVVIQRADVDGLRVYLATDERGLNLTRAVAAKTASPPSDGPAAAFHVDVRKLVLTHGHVSWEKQYTLDEIGIEGGVDVSGPPFKLKGGALATGTLLGDTPLPLSLHALGTEQKLDVGLKLGAAHLDGSYGIAGTHAYIDELLVPPEVAQRFAEDFPLKVPLKASGAASPARLDLKLEAGAARASVKGALSGFEVTADDVDVAELLGQGKPSNIHLDAKGGLTDTNLDTLDGHLAANATWSHLGTAHVKLTASKGKLDLERGNVKVTGAELDLRGSGTLREVHVKGRFLAEDLAKLSAAVAGVTGSAPPPLAGTGELTVALDGPPRHARVTLDGTFQALHVADVSFNAVTLDASFADVGRPFEAQLHAAVARITAGERSFDDVRARIDTRGRELDVVLSTQMGGAPANVAGGRQLVRRPDEQRSPSEKPGLADMSLTARGTVDKDGQGVELSDLGLVYPEATWKLESPTRVSIANGVVIEPLALLSADQRLALQATLQRGRIDALLDAKNVELTRLPHAFVPTKWGLGGKLDAHATATGKSSAPDADASLTWRDGSVRTLRGVQLTAQARWSKDRVAGTFEGRSGIGDVDARFDVPVKGLTAKKPSDEPLSAELNVKNVVLETLGPLLELDLPVKGKASVRLEASGTAREPQAVAHAEARDAVWVLQEPGADRFIPVDSLDVDVKHDAVGKLWATVSARAFGAEADFKLVTPLTLEGMRAKPPTAASLRALEVELIANVNHVKLETLAGANLVAEESLKGGVSVSLQLNGSVDHPDARGAITLAGVASGRLKPIDGTVEITAGRDDTAVKVALSRPGAALVKLEVKAKAPLEALVDVERATTVAFSGDGKVGPFTLADVLEPAEDEAQPRGTVKADVEVSGSVVDPKVKLRGQLDQVAMGKVALGKANVVYDYGAALSTLAVTLFTGNGGTLRGKGTVQLDLSQPAIARGVEWRKAPLKFDVTSNALDLGFLAGTLELLPKVEGQLDADATVSGVLGLPAFVGRAVLTRGRVAVLGYGEYRDIEVRLDGSDEAVTLEKLYAKSAGGYADLTGVAQKRGDGWHARLSGEAKNFPIITDDQLKASLTVELEAEGVLTADFIDVSKLKLPRAVIELPEVKGKDLQDLERPDSIVLVRNGVPVNAKARKKLEERGEMAVQQKKVARVIRITIDAPHNLWLKSGDVNAEVGLSESFRVEVAQGAAMFGEVQVKRGRIDVIGRRFDVDASSTVRFAGPPSRAYVNVVATHKNEREGVTVFATVVGQLPQFSIRLTSNPPLSESDIFALVATGRRTLKQGGSAAITNDQVASVIGALAASQLKGALGKKLPLDVLSIETGSDGLRGTRVEGGKYLSDQVYVGGEVRYGADPKKGENDVAFKLEYQFVPHWGLELYGGNAAYGADLVWSREY